MLALVLMSGCTSQAPPPQEQIDVTGIRAELLTIGQAERQYFAEHSQYASLDDLRSEKLLAADPNRRGYVFSADVDADRGFTVTAAPTDANKANWPTLSIDQTLQVREEAVR
jgi:hypothetical protein